MMFNSPSIAMPPPLHIVTTGRYARSFIDISALDTAGAPASTTWPSNNLALYYPITIDVPTVLSRFFVVNGSTINGTCDVGIYNLNTLARIASTGSQTRTGTSTIQYYDVTDIGLPPGAYYLGLVCSSSTSHVQRVPFASATLTRTTGVMQQALGSSVLPDPMVPVANTSGNYYMWGYTQSATL